MPMPKKYAPSIYQGLKCKLFRLNAEFRFVPVPTAAYEKRSAIFVYPDALYCGTIQPARQPNSYATSAQEGICPTCVRVAYSDRLSGDKGGCPPE